MRKADAAKRPIPPRSSSVCKLPLQLFGKLLGARSQTPSLSLATIMKGGDTRSYLTNCSGLTPTTMTLSENARGRSRERNVGQCRRVPGMRP